MPSTASLLCQQLATLQISTTRIAGGLLWPCKGLLPAAPKDAGFHCVQAQCHCRFGYPLKGFDTRAYSTYLAKCHASPAAGYIF